jgi:glycerol-3-phosphate acyltransferase PlsY
LRTLGKVPALIVFLVDISKGIIPILLAMLIPQLNAAGWGPSVAGIAALLGHCFRVFIGFKGGRGVATGAGAVLIISPPVFLLSLIATASTIAIWRYVSLGSIVGGLTTLIGGVVFYFVSQANPAFFVHVSLAQLLFLVVGPSLVIIFHYDNIGRLLAGTERKIGQKVAVSPEGAEKSAPSH